MTTQIENAARMATAWWIGRLLMVDKADELRAALQPKIFAALQDQGYIRLENDYDPRGVLLAAVREAGIECDGYMFSGRNIFPDKHTLMVRPDRLEPKEGYGNLQPAIHVPPDG